MRYLRPLDSGYNALAIIHHTAHSRNAWLSGILNPSAYGFFSSCAEELWAEIDRLVICKMSSSSFTCSASTQTVVSKVTHVHHLFSDLLDLAIYSFGCQRGLRAHHKVRGGSVLEGVSAILGRMLLTRNPETKAAFEEITPTRLGSWLFLNFRYLGTVWLKPWRLSLVTTALREQKQNCLRVKSGNALVNCNLHPQTPADSRDFTAQ